MTAGMVHVAPKPTQAGAASFQNPAQVGRKTPLQKPLKTPYFLPQNLQKVPFS